MGLGPTFSTGLCPSPKDGIILLQERKLQLGECNGLANVEGRRKQEFFEDSWGGVEKVAVGFRVDRSKDRFEIVYSQVSTTFVEILVDRQTGVNYLFTGDYHGGGLTVLLDRNGKPVITTVEPNPIVL